MHMSEGAAIKAYQQIDVRSEIDGATPHRLIQLLMERVLTKIAHARGFMERKAVNQKGNCISDAISIISGLKASLNHKPNARLSGNFDALYDYMSRRLLEANLRNDDAILKEVASLMYEVKEAWDAIADEISGMELSQVDS